MVARLALTGRPLTWTAQRRWATYVPDDLLVSQLDIGTTVLEAHDGDVLETH
jgi:hypothetical protein